ncbi:hypothetical protein [Streptomyces sp. NBC_00358]|uniref:hypothetical protein n=1 Tax=Streptomyces sp. NBC_00358 TaxID=2975725 RepID=UPI0032443DFF
MTGSRRAMRGRRRVRAVIVGTAVRLSNLVRVLLGVQAGIKLGRPGEGPGAQVGQLAGIETIVGEVLVVPPFGTVKAVAQVLEAEFEACVAAAERFEVGSGAVLGGGVDVDEVADCAAVCERV